MIVKLLHPKRSLALNPFCSYTNTNDELLLTVNDTSTVLKDPLSIQIFDLLVNQSSISLLELSLATNTDLSILIFRCSEWVSKNYFMLLFDDSCLQKEYHCHLHLGLSLNDLNLASNGLSISIDNFSSLDTDFSSYLKQLPVTKCVPRELEGKVITIFVVDDSLDQKQQDKICSTILHSGTLELFAIIFMKPLGILFSPLFTNESSPCPECFFKTLNESNEISMFQAHAKTKSYNYSTYSFSGYFSVESFCSLIYSHLVKRLYRLDNLAPVDSYVEYIDNIGRDLQKYHVLRRHMQCSNGSCHYDFNAISDLISDLSSSSLIDKSQSGYRSISTTQFIENTNHLISAWTGVVKYLEKVTETDTDMYHVYNSGHNWAVNAKNISQLKSGLRTNSQGKGATDAQAKAGAIAEAIERYSAIHNKFDSTICGSEESLTQRFASLNSILKFSDKQFSSRDTWNLNNYRFARIPNQYNSSTVLEWSEGYDLIKESTILIPSSCLFFNYQWPDEDSWYSVACSNGLSVGSNCQDSIIQGFLELVERDAVGIWWYNMYQCPGIDPKSFSTPYIDELHQFYRLNNRELYFLNLTTDLEIPVIAAISYRTDKNKKDILMAFGAHFDPVIAAQRALGELNQFYPAVSSIIDDSDSNYNYDDPQSRDWWSTATLENQPYLKPSNNTDPPTHFFDSNPPKTTIEIIDRIKQLCCDHSFDLYAFNYTKPNIGISCTKTIVPQLSHFWARYNCDRLYNVPVKLGYLTEPKPEDSFNPIPMFL